MTKYKNVLCVRVKDQNNVDHFFNKQIAIHREFVHEGKPVNSEFRVKALEKFIGTYVENEASNLR